MYKIELPKKYVPSAEMFLNEFARSRGYNYKISFIENSKVEDYLIKIQLLEYV
jgi:hypothetical protein